MQSQTDEAPQDDTILEVENAEVTFEMSRGRARVLDGIDIEIKRGETFGVVGESGCGKSMFGSSLLDAVEDPGVLTGSVTYYPEDGEPVDILGLNTRQTRQLRWKEIATVSQGAMNAFNPTANVRSHFKETLAAHNANKEEGMAHARELLQEVNLDPDRILDAYQHELSGGEKQRVLLALSLVLDPEILIMDEPTAALDLLMQRKILGLLHDLKDEYDITLLMISHDIPVVSGFADRIGVMYAFDFIERGDAESVLLDSKHPYTRLLLGSTLHLDTPVDEVQLIEGETPDPVNVPVGCPFHPRCPVSDDRCEESDPALVAEEEGDHEVACFYPDAARENIPVTIDYGGENE
jgi:oligopeptide/dipeptide ABC transporter ATP-binding protein